MNTNAHDTAATKTTAASARAPCRKVPTYQTFRLPWISIVISVECESTLIPESIPQSRLSRRLRCGKAAARRLSFCGFGWATTPSNVRCVAPAAQEAPCKDTTSTDMCSDNICALYQSALHRANTTAFPSRFWNRGRCLQVSTQRFCSCPPWDMLPGAHADLEGGGSSEPPAPSRGPSAPARVNRATRKLQVRKAMVTSVRTHRRL